MNEDYRRAAFMEAQRAATAYGTIFYEESGLGTLGEVTGEIALSTEAAVIFADPAALITEQHRVYIPIHRVVRIEFTPNL